jgi:enoyl-[acyl-carrier protein] reductase I
MGLFSGKKILVLGVANEKSIAWSISEALSREGAELAFTYVNEAIEKRVRPLAEKLGRSEYVYQCDVQSDEHLDKLFSDIKERWGKLDGVVHSVAYADRADLQNPFSKTSREGFRLALDVSAYSLVAVSGRAQELMTEGGAILTLTYLGSQRAITNYNVMGVAKAALESSVRYLASDLGGKNIRVNALSAGPIKTLAASGIPQFRELLTAFAEKAPLKRTVTLDDVAKSALFYLSDMSSGITGEVTYVDCGFNIAGL